MLVECTSFNFLSAKYEVVEMDEIASVTAALNDVKKNSDAHHTQ